MTIVPLEELQTRASFVRTVAAGGRVHLVEGSEGFARVPSPRQPGRMVELMWAERAEAARWADALVREPRVITLGLDALLARHLPKLAEDKLVVGCDWSDAPAEPEISAVELDRLLRRHLIDSCVDLANKTRQVWILKSGDIPATLLTRHPGGGETLPVFADRASAERSIDGPWSQTVATRVPIGDFVQKTIVWCVETRRRIAPGYVPGPGLIEMPAWDMKALLAGHAQARRVA
jgi:hypothetical protein